MKLKAEKSSNKKAFTIVELITVITVIILLISLVMPASNVIRKYARTVKQKAQFHAINTALEVFNVEYEGYPPSDDPGQKTSPGTPYCGAVKLCEALMGQDLEGFYPFSDFDAGSISDYNDLTIGIRKDLYLQPDNAEAHRLAYVWGYVTGSPPVLQTTAGHDGALFVLCDVYKRFTNKDPNSKGKIGMPVLYYKANTISKFINPYDPNEKNIYNYYDNAALIDFTNPLGDIHPMANSPVVFYGEKAVDYPSKDNQYYYPGIRNTSISGLRPNRADSFILMSAGPDGLYGTKDDMFNF
ncbi:MAG: type II secretion system protein [Planctomycetota bacterium]